MPDVNPIAIAAATAAVFILSSTYYAVLSAQWAEVSDAATPDRPGPRKVALELRAGGLWSPLARALP